MSDVMTRNGSTEGISPKTIVATFLAAVLGTAAALANLAQRDPSLLGSLPPAVQTVAIIALPTIVTAIGTWRAAVGRIAIPERDLPVVVDGEIVRD